MQHEINRRREVEQDLIDAEKLFRTTFENAAVGMAHVSLDGSWLRTNERLSEITGYPSEELNQLTFQDITHPDDLGNDLQNLKKLLAGEIDKYAIEKRYIHKLGHPVWILLTVSMVKKSDGSPDHFISIVQDISERKKLEDKSARTQQLLTAFLENAPSAMGVVELPPDNSDILHLLDNQEAEKLLRTEPGGTVGKWSKKDLNMWDQAVDTWIEKYREAQRDQTQINFQIEVLNEESKEFKTEDHPWLNVSISYLGPGDDNRDRFCYIAVDDTFRKQAESQLQRSHDTFYHLIESAPFGIYLVDDDLQVLQFSEGFRLYYQQFQPRIGIRLAEVYEQLWGAEIAAEVVSRFKNTFETGERFQARDALLNRHDIDLAEYFDWEVQRVTLPDGNYGVVCYFYNTTQLKAAELRAQESMNRLRLATELVNVGVAVCECHAKTMTLDKIAADQFGLPANTPIPIENFRNCFAPASHELLDKQMQLTLSSCDLNNQSFEYRIVREDGTVRWLGISMQVECGSLPDGTLEPNHWLIASTDLTERKQHEEQLELARTQAESANRARGEFLANMSHEIRTPMAALMGHVEILHAHLNDPDNKQSLLTIKRNGSHLLEILNDILDLSRIEAGKMEVESAQCNVIQLLSDIESLMRVRVESDKVQFRVHSPEPIPRYIHTDTKRLKQILLNLVGNAIKFTHEGSIEIIVSCNKADGRIEFAVSDTGIGIPADVLKTLFQPFSQGDASRTRKYGGSGLGLAISQRLAEMLNGHIKVVSTPGAGSTFTVSLPYGVNDDSEFVTLDAIDQPEEDLPLAIRQIDGRVLLVDDRRDIRFVGQNFLEEAGASVSTASDGQEALQMVEQAAETENQFQVIIMDVQMPNMDGNTAVSRLRSAGYQIPIISLTADAMREDRDRCMAAGADDYLTKPIDKAELINKVAYMMHDVSWQDLARLRAERSQNPPGDN
ncbi:MAG: PAS domain S-box protein [Planctomycetaceae bacterium]